MNELLTRIRQHAARTPAAAAVRDEHGNLSYGQLVQEIERLAAGMNGERTGLLLDNGIPWACLDLAILERGGACVPMPAFFSRDQLRHLIRDADLDLIVTDQPERVAELLEVPATAELEVAGRRLSLFRRLAQHSGLALPAGTAKVTYTSGTTGQPKGVCLSGANLKAVTESICGAVEANPSDRSLSLLPLSTLLENIAGLYAPLWTGALAQVPSLASCGFIGSSGLSIEGLFTALGEAKPTITVLVPQLLKALVSGIAYGLPTPDCLRFVAVGGAPVSESLLHEARLFGLPVFQGFGLSEAGSVVCLNLPRAERPGSVGKPLPHAGVRIADDGEVVVNGRLFLGYLGANGHDGEEWHTGDLGHLDEDGYLFLTGRKKTSYSTAFGRNVAPEWVEGALTGHPHIAQAAVFGAGRPFNAAVIVPRPGIEPRTLSHAVATVNQQLPDYARIGAWITAAEPFAPFNGLASGSGCIQRTAIQSKYGDAIAQLYSSEENHAVL